MAWQKMIDKPRMRGGNSQSMTDHGKWFRITRTEVNKNGSSPLTVTLSTALAKELRWMIGDSIQIFIDNESGLVALGRDSVGWKVTPNSPKKKSSDYAGSVMKCNIKFAVPPSSADAIISITDKTRVVENPLIDESGFLVIAETAATKNGKVNRLTTAIPIR